MVTNIELLTNDEVPFEQKKDALIYIFEFLMEYGDIEGNVDDFIIWSGMEYKNYDKLKLCYQERWDDIYKNIEKVKKRYKNEYSEKM